MASVHVSVVVWPELIHILGIVAHGDMERQRKGSQSCKTNPLTAALGIGPILVGEHGSLYKGRPLGCKGLLMHWKLKKREVKVVTCHKITS